jgi:hypothetical protein
MRSATMQSGWFYHRRALLIVREPLLRWAVRMPITRSPWGDTSVLARFPMHSVGMGEALAGAALYPFPLLDHVRASGSLLIKAR